MGSININGKNVKKLTYKGKNVKSLSMNGKVLTFPPPPPVIPLSKMVFGVFKENVSKYTLIPKLNVELRPYDLELYTYTFLGDTNPHRFPLWVSDKCYLFIKKFVSPTKTIDGYIDFNLVIPSDPNSGNCVLKSGIKLGVWYPQGTKLWQDGDGHEYPSSGSSGEVKIVSFKPDTRMDDGYIQVELRGNFP